MPSLNQRITTTTHIHVSKDEDIVDVCIKAEEGYMLTATISKDSLLKLLTNEKERMAFNFDREGSFIGPNLAANDPGIPLDDPELYIATDPKHHYSWQLLNWALLIGEAAKQLCEISHSDSNRKYHYKYFRAAMRALHKPLNDWVSYCEISDEWPEMEKIVRCLDEALKPPRKKDLILGRDDA